MTKHFNSKLVLSGNILEIREYEKTQYFDSTTTLPKSNKKTKELSEKEMQKKTYRAIKNVKRLIACNYNYDDTKAKFITLTFSEGLPLKDAKNKLKLFQKKLNHNYGYSAKYIAVAEPQKNGKLHFHIIYFGLPYIKHSNLKELWTYGSLNIKKIEYSESSFNNLTKYILKDRILGKDRYFRSKGNLKEPIEVRNDLIFNKIKHLIRKEDLTYNFENRDEYDNAYTIKSIDINKLPPEHKNLIQAILRDSD